MIFYRDGIEEQIDEKPSVYETRDGHVVEQYKVEGATKYFVTLNGTPYCAHGITLDEAIADATWKDPAKRPSLESLKEEIQRAGKDRPITLNEFQVLTGACREGCKIALKKKKLDGSPMTAREVHNYFPDWGKTLHKVLEWHV